MQCFNIGYLIFEMCIQLLFLWINCEDASCAVICFILKVKQNGNFAFAVCDGSPAMNYVITKSLNKQV